MKACSLVLDTGETVAIVRNRRFLTINDGVRNITFLNDKDAFNSLIERNSIYGSTDSSFKNLLSGISVFRDSHVL